MKDGEARFAFKIALLVHRYDFWNIRDEMSAYEWAMLKAMFLVEPWGEDRADIRAQVNTNYLCAAQGAQLDDDDLSRLRFYLKANAPKDEPLSPEQQRILLEG